ncbi:LLM class flavin-dependent oxidoreductase [Nocardia terpenica]|uniref:Oxidoreductase n=1 Tax=Nocardia terpenica TaxID=455432 RepID=A0A161XCM6_9NOCA|nr:LLM class flavin-dependent oxidoreductase [Nocardia terpenica]KZM70988.1 oxidoreductase [Nocardia terpenica]MBF6060051.1 LLM class flavin-dependent oxidoreductase [Nocardia terpenica]MBF6103311.1 LLM class flavin-dependent oxidoreductase [Nocardia terpenica]MBF6112315.1 LLM class flavin-dependent oxidoreductase [Nocardia terpenica]MBF6117532.1 LLM class flavin-dependent oxidoreductase [Nocardia terpenica]
MTTLGAVFLPENPPERLREVARAAEEAGLEELWLWEDCFQEGGVATVAAALAWTERLRVGIGVFPVPLRNVALAAMEIASVERMFPGRTVWGVGHGVQDWMGQIGARVDSPVTLLREYVDALRKLLAGKQVSTEGRYVRLTDVALDYPPATAPAIISAATGPRTLRLVGEVADGAILTSGTSPNALRAARELLTEGREKAGRTDGFATLANLMVATGPDALARLRADAQRMGRELTAEFGMPGPDGIGVAGDAKAVAEAVGRLAEAGADTVILQPTADLDPVEFIRFVADEVRPLVP